MITYNIKLQFETSQNENYWINILKTQQDCYNYLSDLLFSGQDCQKSNEKQILGIKVIHDKFYRVLRDKFPEFPSQMVIKTEQDVIATFKSIRSNKHVITEAPKKKSLSMRLDKRIYSKFYPDSINLTSEISNHKCKVHLLNYPKSSELFKNYLYRDPLIFNKDGIFYLSVSFDVPEKPTQNEEVLGVDLGVRRLFTTSDGTSLSGKEFSKNKRKIRYSKRMLEHTNTASSKRHLKKLVRKERNFSKKYIELAVNKLLETDKSVIVIEDLTGIKTNKKGKQSKTHNNRISQVPFYLFKQILSYKAPLVGKSVETVNPAYTSQIDSMTGKKEGERRFVRFYSVGGVIYDADWNAANNIARKSEHPFSCKVPLDGSLHFLGRLMSTSQKFDRNSVEPTEQAAVL